MSTLKNLWASLPETWRTWIERAIMLYLGYKFGPAGAAKVSGIATLFGF